MKYLCIRDYGLEFKKGEVYSQTFEDAPITKTDGYFFMQGRSKIYIFYNNDQSLERRFSDYFVDIKEHRDKLINQIIE